MEAWYKLGHWSGAMVQGLRWIRLLLLALFVCLSVQSASEGVSESSSDDRRSSGDPSPPVVPGGKGLKTIFNNDINNILLDAGKDGGTVADYRTYLDRIMALKPGVLAQNVGLPDAVIYPSQVATTFDKYLVEVSRQTWPDVDYDKQSVPQEQCLRNLFKAGTDPLTLAIETCRRHGVLIVASYRMNAEDWYHNTYLLTDFGRDHPAYRIPNRGCLDPAIRQYIFPFIYDARAIRQYLKQPWALPDGP